MDFGHGDRLGGKRSRDGPPVGSPKARVTFFVFPFSLFLFGAVQQPPAAPPPAALVEALKAEPGVRLLVPATDLREYSEAELRKFGYWPPWLVRDLDGDKQADVAAVVVKPSPAGTEYGVVAIHAQAPRSVEWVVPLDTEPINGGTQGPAPDTVVPLFCVACDAGLWFRWSGEEYETTLYAAGEKIDIGSETQADLPLYSSANLASKPVTTVPHCTTVVVQKLGGTPDLRWYFVETPDGQRGWVSDKVTAPDICVG